MSLRCLDMCLVSVEHHEGLEIRERSMERVQYPRAFNGDKSEVCDLFTTYFTFNSCTYFTLYSR